MRVLLESPKRWKKIWAARSVPFYPESEQRLNRKTVAVLHRRK